MKTTFLIDAHEDISSNSLEYGRDIRVSALVTRQREKNTTVPLSTGECLLGWDEFQQGQVALVFGTLFTVHKRHTHSEWNAHAYTNTEEAVHMLRAEADYYHRLTDTTPDKFRLVTNKKELAEVLTPWQTPQNETPNQTRPVGIVMSIESAEGLHRPEDLQEFWEAGVRFVGPVWAGGRYCGGTIEPGGFTPEGERLLDVMMEYGFTLDLSHMNEKSARQALERYDGCIIASHANVRSLLKEDPHERQLSNDVIRGLIEKDGVMGVIPYNRFLVAGWKRGDPRNDIHLDKVIAHIDAICQLAGDARHVAIGSDFDGGFGYQDVPCEIETIADIQKFVDLLAERGYSQADIQGIFHGNWLRILDRTLP